MSTYQTAKEDLRTYILAGVPFVIVQSGERHRVERMVREIVREKGIHAFCYTDARQVQALGGTGVGTSKDVSSDPLLFVNELFLKAQHMVMLIADTARLDHDSLYTRELLGAVYTARATRNTLVVVACEELWGRLSNLGLQIRLASPDFDERIELIRDFMDQQGTHVAWTEADAERLATLTRGLSELQLVNLMRSSLVKSGTLQSADVPGIGACKERLFAPVSSVTRVHVDDSLRVAGLGGLKRWLARKRDVFFASQQQLDAFALSAPKGVLLVGVPGCGKSFSARMVASLWQLPLLRFDLGSVYDKYVGESERQMREALAYIDDVAPCVLWVDEIEKALATTSGESDVGQRVLGQFLFWLQESRARVFLVATANDVAKLPPELFRKGRFSETFFVDVPDRAERAEAIALYAERSLHTTFGSTDSELLVTASEGFSYADIEQVITDLAEQVAFCGCAVPDAKTIARHFSKTVPITKANDAIAEIRAWGAQHARPASWEGGHEQF